MPANFQIGATHNWGLSSIVSTTYLWCKKMLLNIEIADKIGSRLIEKVAASRFPRWWSEKAEGRDQSTDSRDARRARTG